MERVGACQSGRCPRTFPGTIKGAQAQMRHASPDLILRTCMQAIPESVRDAVYRFEQSLASIPGSDTIQ
jgi:hypothetical protein